MFLAVSGSFLTGFLSNATSIAIPYMALELGMSNILENWIATIFLLTVAAFSVPLNFVSGRLGLKKAYILGLVIFLLGTIFAALSFDSFTILASRVIQGVGGALIVSRTLIATEFDSDERGEGIGLNVVGTNVASFLAPVIGGFLAFNFGWRSIFYSLVPFILLILILSIFKFPEDDTSQDESPF